MAHAGARKLVFRLGETGFLLDLDRVVEICEQLTEHFNPSQTDMGQGIVGSLHFRQTLIPVVDPALHLKTHSQLAITKKSALILKGTEGNWALLVDRVEEIVPKDKLQTCEIPLLLKSSIAGYYSQVCLLLDEPLICFEPEQYYGSTPVAI
jgi:chemotaxis signal transduction protein